MGPLVNLAPWCWEEASNYPADACRLVEYEWNPECAFELKEIAPVSPELLNELQTVGAAIGVLYDAVSVKEEFITARNELKSRCDLTHDGLIRVPADVEPQLFISNCCYYASNYVIHAARTEGRLSHQSEKIAKALGIAGPSLDTLDITPAILALLQKLEHEEAIAILRPLRNLLEHTPVMISPINYDASSREFGLGISVTPALLERVCKRDAAAGQKLYDFCLARKEAGNTPLYSFGDFCRCVDSYICVLGICQCELWEPILLPQLRALWNELPVVAGNKRLGLLANLEEMPNAPEWQTPLRLYEIKSPTQIIDFFKAQLERYSLLLNQASNEFKFHDASLP